MGNGLTRSQVTTRTVYLVVRGRTQQVEFSRNCTSRDIKDLFASEAGVSRGTNFVLTTQDASTVVIEPNMPLNTARSPYMVSISPKDQTFGEEETLQGILGQVAETFTSTSTAIQLKTKTDTHLQKMEGKVAESLKLVGLQHRHQDMSEIWEQIRQERIAWLASRDDQNTSKMKVNLLRPVPCFSKYTLSPETIQFLREPSFNIWYWEPNEMICLFENMYHELGIVDEFKINPNVLRRFLLCIQDNYKDNPFHNFRRCFCVTQMMYCTIHFCKLTEKLAKKDILVLLTACVCLDLEHPGYNNTYQVNARTELSIRYNDISPLENHHASVAFDILSQPECNIFANVSRKEFQTFRQDIVMLILATDMARHSEIVEKFKNELDTFNFKNDECLKSLMMILIKCCDMSNEVRPMEVSDPWADRLLEEYFMQSDREKSEGLPVSSFMDRDKVTKPTAQIGFIKFVLIPMFESLSKLFPQVGPAMVGPLLEANEHYELLRQKEIKLRRGIDYYSHVLDSATSVANEAEDDECAEDKPNKVRTKQQLSFADDEEKQNKGGSETRS